MQYTNSEIIQACSRTWFYFETRKTCRKNIYILLLYADLARFILFSYKYLPSYVRAKPKNACGSSYNAPY
jgi:hypothetical protein